MHVIRVCHGMSNSRKGQRTAALTGEWEYFLYDFYLPTKLCVLSSCCLFIFLSLFTIFSHFCCERCSTRRLLQKQIRRKLNGFVVFDTALPPTDQGENEKRDEINVEVNEKKNTRGTGRKINFILSISSVASPLSLSLYGCKSCVCLCVRETLFPHSYVWPPRSAFLSSLYSPSGTIRPILCCLLHYFNVDFSLSHFLQFFPSTFCYESWGWAHDWTPFFIFLHLRNVHPTDFAYFSILSVLLVSFLSLSLSLSLFVYFYPTSALVSQVAGEWTSVQAQIAKGDGERVRIVKGAGEAKSFGLAYKFYLWNNL